MRSMTAIVTLEIEELHLQISGRPEESAVQTFAPNGANQPFNEWMRKRHGARSVDSPRSVPLFHVDGRGDDLLARSLGARPRRPFGREEPAILPLYQRSMKAQQR